MHMQFHYAVFLEFVLLLITMLGVMAKDSLIKDTEYGQVRGFTTSPQTGKTVENYLGIPYAVPPVHNLRFEPPRRLNPWSPKVKDAFQLPSACLQIAESVDYIQRHRPLFNETSEDCLYLNIYVPVIPENTELLSVLVFIHGGSNMAGMGAFFDGDFLASHGRMIVLTFNYRLAALGFLGTGKSEFPGNYGLLDQVLFLKWVNKNIVNFGGDAEKVTLMGHSAGSFNVGLHILSPLTKGLFRTAICLSGSPLAEIAVQRSSGDSISTVELIGRQINCVRRDLYGIKECLKKTPRKTLMKYFPGMYSSSGGIYYFPTIVDNVYINAHPEELFKTAPLNVDLVVTGVTKDEGATFASGAKSFPELKNLLNSSELALKTSELYAVIKHEYTHWENQLNETAQKQLYAQAFGDAMFNAPLARMADLLVERNATVYVYKFEYRSELDPRPISHGVPHGADLFFLFGCPFSGHPRYNYTDEDRNISLYYMDMISNIVKHRIATYPKNISDPTSLLTAPAYNPLHPKYIRFYGHEGGPRVDLGNNFRSRKLYLWNKLLPFLEEKFSNNTVASNTGSQEPDNVFVILFGIFLATTILQLVALAVCFLLIRRHRYK